MFSDIKRIKEFVLAGQTVNSAYFCGLLLRLGQNVRRLRPELWRQKNWLLYHDNAPSHTSFFIREFLTKNKMTVVAIHPSLLTRPPATFLCFPSFWHSWGDRGRFAGGAEHDFQDAFKMAEALRTVHTRGRELFRGWWWALSTKLVFDQMIAPVSEIMDGSLCVGMITNTIRYIDLRVYCLSQCCYCT
jgi:hypothetical protein